MGKKIVLMYEFFSEHGGIERIMLFQARALRKAGYDVSFAFAYVDENLKKERLSGFEVIEYARLPIKNETLQISTSIFRRDSLEKLRFADLIICHSFPGSCLALKAKKKFGSKLILHLHHPPQFLYTADLNWAKNSLKRQVSFILGKVFKRPLRNFDYHCVKGADDYFAESNAVKEIVDKCYAINSTVLYPTVDNQFKTERVSLKELSKYRITKDYVLGSGRIIKQKRFDYLIQAFAKIKNDDLNLVLVGKYDDVTKMELENVAKENNVNVLFLGPVDIKELIKIYNLAKVTVVTCPKEWFGLVSVEAMTCGCPVIGWKDNFGPQEAVTEGKSGFLAKPYSVSDLSKKIQIALDKKWNKKQIINSTQKFSEREQEKILLKKVKKFI